MQVAVDWSKYEPLSQAPGRHRVLLPSYVHAWQLVGQSDEHTDTCTLWLPPQKRQRQ